MRKAFHLLFFVLLWTAPAAAQPTAAPPAELEAAAPAETTATLILGNRKIVTFRAPFGQLSPSQRVEGARRRISELEDPVTREQIVAAEIAEGWLISVGSRALFVVVEEDVDPVVEQDLDDLREATVANLAQALAERAERRRPIVLLQAAGRCAVATAVFLLAIGVLRWLRSILVRRLQRVADQHLSRFDVLGVDALRLSLTSARFVVGLAFWTAWLSMAYAWLAFVLESFPYSRPWGEALGSYVTVTLGELGLGALAAMPDLLTAILIFALARFLTRMVSAFFESVETRRITVEWCHPETASATRRIVVGLCWIFAVVFAYPYLPGSESEAFRAVGVLVGLMVSLGSSGLVNQVMSGLVLIYSRALKPGEFVRVGEVEGMVTELGLLSTKLVTPRKRFITIPNAVVVANTLDRGDWRHPQHDGDSGL